MGKDPAFLFYPNDWLGGTLGMTFEEKGAYLELLMLQFNRGHMTAHMIGQTVGQLWDKIKDKFVCDSNGLYYNERLESEVEKRRNYCESRKNNISGKNQYSNNSGHMTTHTTSHMDGHTTGHMENENGNRNNSIDIDDNTPKKNKKKGVKASKEVEAFFEKAWELYPKKEGKGSVSDSQKNEIYKLGEEFIRCIERYIAAKAGKEPQFIKMGSTFFNSGYVDYLDKNYSQQALPIEELTQSEKDALKGWGING